MSSGTTGIQWTDATWNPVAGCTPVSPGCLNCYAATMARRLEAMGQKDYQPRVEAERQTMPDAFGVRTIPAQTFRIAEVKGGVGGRAVFTGEVRCLPERLTAPLHWKKPRMIFVNSMSDLFHEAVPFEYIDKVFAVMALCPQHTFQVLTKRPERMAEYFSRSLRERRGEVATAVMGVLGSVRVKGVTGNEMDVWPLPNVWLGTSVEDQTRADERIPHLLRCPAAVRFLSCEPLLGAVNLGDALAQTLLTCQKCGEEYGEGESDRGRSPCCHASGDPNGQTHDGIQWAIVGGESGANARPCDVAWVRSIVNQCRAASVPCFVKQLGARPEGLRDWCDKCNWQVKGGTKHSPDCDRSPVLIDRKGGDMAEWPEDLRVREMPGRT